MPAPSYLPAKLGYDAAGILRIYSRAHTAQINPFGSSRRRDMMACRAARNGGSGAHPDPIAAPVRRAWPPQALPVTRRTPLEART